ncbi:MAG: saccharopine dehydrogenase NADP-binding domain-containing protein [Chitinophagales bacterium]
MTQLQMIYGATGYMGKLITRMMSANGLKPVLAGRSEAVKQLAAKHGLAYRIFSLEDQKEVNKNLQGISLLMNLAGPFNKTNAPLITGCIENKVHYTDISGEATGYETVYSFNENAKSAGVMLMPGTGFGIVPTDVMALHLKQQMPDGNKLILAFAVDGGASRGTMKVGVKAMHEPGIEVINGKKQVTLPATKSFHAKIGSKEVKMVLNPWRGDLFTAPITTGIQNVSTYTAFPAPLVFIMKHPGIFRGVMKSKLMDWIVGLMPEGPDEEKFKSGKSYVYGKITNENGQLLECVMTGPEAYLYTAITTLRIAENILKGDFKPGFQTPAGMYGTALIEGMEGVKIL